MNDDTEILDAIVHDTASEIASSVCNNMEHEEWLTGQGWTVEQIAEEVRTRKKG